MLLRNLADMTPRLSPCSKGQGTASLSSLLRTGGHLKAGQQEGADSRAGVQSICCECGGVELALDDLYQRQIRRVQAACIVPE